MKKILFIFLCFLSHYIYGQQSLRGIIVDRSDNTPLENSSVVLLDKDSIMRYFTRTNENGAFKLDSIKTGTYLLLASYPKFEVYSQKIAIDEKMQSLDSIKISSQTNLLEEVVINQKIPIKIKGDTIEYDAGSFATEKNAKLEDLLRRLPGLTVSASGQITAQGKTVSKVLIDGEEFFGYDPKIAIRNVRADAIDKVQVYERKSDEAELTGVDDGVRLQTVNVVLKEEARKSVFGNADASIGTRTLFDANLFAAIFNKGERIGVQGNWNNMGNDGYAGRIRTNNQITGKPSYKSLGVNYENNFFKKKARLTSSYNISDNGQTNESKNFNTRVLDDNHTQETSQNNNSNSTNRAHILRAQMQYKLDSVSYLDIQVSGNKRLGESMNNGTSKTTRDNNVSVNGFDQKNSNNTNSDGVDLLANYHRRLNKRGQSLNINLNTQHDNTKTTNHVNDSTSFYTAAGALERATVVNQKRQSKDGNNTFGGSINISDKIAKLINLTVGYSFNTAKQENLTDAYNNDSGNNASSVLDSLYSKNQVNSSTSNSLDFNIDFNLEKVTINVSNQLAYQSQGLRDSYRGFDLQRHFWQNNFNANALYNISKSKSLTMVYQNSTNVPEFSQLQALQPPTNELYKQLGNPDLKREVRNSINLSFNRFNLLRASSFSINASTSFTNNAIVDKSTIDNEGRTTATFVNIDGHVNWNANLHANYGRPLFQGLVQFGPSAMVFVSNNYEYINGELNKNNTANANFGLNANKQSSKYIDFNVYIGLGLNKQSNSIQTKLNNTAFQSNANAELKYFLPYKFTLTQVLYYSFAGKTKVFPEPIQQFYMNLEVAHKLLKDESLSLNIKAFDVFNSFNNINRSAGNNTFSETQQDMLSQYFLVGLAWDFNKYLGKKND